MSHAVGCAFAACLERKQRRDKECGVTMTFDSKTSTFTRSGSFRQPSLTERLQESRDRAVGEYRYKLFFINVYFHNYAIFNAHRKTI